MHKERIPFKEVNCLSYSSDGEEDGNRGDGRYEEWKDGSRDTRET